MAKENSICIGADLGGTNLRLAAIDSDGRLVDKRVLKTRQLTQHGTAAAGLVEQLRSFASAQSLPVCAGAVGFPSTIDRQRRNILSTPNVPGLDGIDVAAELSEPLGIPLYVEKDGSMLLYNDIYRNALPQQGIILGIYYGTGIGNAIFYNGTPLAGKSGAAGELGHIPCLDKAKKCSCGNTGCIEEYVGGKALQRLAARRYPQTPLAQLFVQHCRDERLLKFVADMTIPAAAEVNILDPEYLVVGGGVVNMPSFPFAFFETALRDRLRRPFPHDSFTLIKADSSELAGAMGAAAYARKCADAAKQ